MSGRVGQVALRKQKRKKKAQDDDNKTLDGTHDSDCLRVSVVDFALSFGEDRCRCPFSVVFFFLSEFIMGKSELKKIFREHCRNAIRYVPVEDTLTRDGGVHADDADDVHVLFEDASVRYAGGSFAAEGNLGLHAVYAFVQPVHDAFERYTQLHTFIMCFDKKSLVPTAKARTQAQRTEALAKAAADVWMWDGHSVIVSTDNALPPWKNVRLDSRAYKQALEELLDLIVERLEVPPGKRVIIDAEFRGEQWPYVIIGGLDGKRVFSGFDASLRNSIGEADMVGHALAANHYFGGDDAVSSREAGALFMGNNVCVRTVDTDYLPLCLAALAMADIEGTTPLPTTWIRLNAVTCNEALTDVLFGTKAKESEPNSRRCYEVYKMSTLYNAIVEWTRKTTQDDALDPGEAVLSFVVVSIIFGNDYVFHPYGMSLKTLWTAYAGMLAQGSMMLLVRCVSLPGSRVRMPVVLPGMFGTYALTAYGVKCGLLSAARDPVHEWATLRPCHVQEGT